MATERNLPDETREGRREPGAPHASVPTGWTASLDLEFATLGSRTLLARRASSGPLVVQRPFYPEGPVCHVYVVHPPGGVVGGDTLELSIRAEEGTHALITTPAATKFYRSDGRVATQKQAIVAESATVEWLPQETILFPDAHARIATCVRLSERSRFIGWEIACFGRPASRLALGAGRVAQDFELWTGGTPVVLDHLRLDGRSESMRAAFGLADYPVLGTLFAYPANDALLEMARKATDGGMATEGALEWACTRVDGALVCRAVGAHTDAVRRLFTAVWQRVRPAITGRAAVPPRIWAT